tara:strand:- start:8483 stop:9553 length:1071 start_codon:yes stop_codon:yes gene_type:complete
MAELKLRMKADTSYHDMYDRYEPIAGNDYIIVDWMMGNTCNYHCTYCDDYFHDGSQPWPEVDVFLKFTKRLTDHYRVVAPGKRILWNLLGGEPTVWPKFEEVFHKMKAYDPNASVRILTNGSRTLRWWEKNANIFDEVIISYHPQSADYKHITEVSNILTDKGTICSIQSAIYPPLIELNYEAAQYYHENSKCIVHNSKALQETLGSDNTFVYPEGAFDKLRQWDGQTKYRQEIDDADENESEHMMTVKKFKRKNFGKQMRYINTKTGKSESFQNANHIMEQGHNSWKGWKCMIGIEALVVNLNGTVTSGNSCFLHLSHGNINKPDEIVFPTDGRICPQTWCSCVSDTEVTKFKVK